MGTRSVVIAVTVAAVLALTSCAAEAAPRRTVLPTPGITSSASASATTPTTPPATPPSPTGEPSAPAGAIEVACPGGSASVSAGSGSYVLTEPCTRVAVAGNAIILETGGVAIDTLLVQGDGNTISGSGVAGTVTLEGQDNVVATGRADDVTIRGQRNSLTSADRIALLEIAGSANTIAAPGIGTSTVSGDGNTYPGS